MIHPKAAGFNGGRGQAIVRAMLMRGGTGWAYISSPAHRPAGPATQAWGDSETDRRAGVLRPMTRAGPYISSKRMVYRTSSPMKKQNTSPHQSPAERGPQRRRGPEATTDRRAGEYRHMPRTGLYISGTRMVWRMSFPMKKQTTSPPPPPPSGARNAGVGRKLRPTAGRACSDP